MAKSKVDKWLTPESLTLLGGWARNGLIDEQIAKNMGISRSTLDVWKNKYSDISDALKKGKEIVDYEVENALYQNAIGGNVTAQIFWLKNRKRKEWKEAPEEEPSDNRKTVIIDDLPKSE